MNQARFDITMDGNGIRHFEIPTGMNYVAILNSTDNTIEVYQKHVAASSLQDALIEVVPYHNITIPIRAGHGTQFTVIYTDGGIVNEKRVSLLFSDVNLNINSQTGSVSGSSNVVLTSESVGLARQNQFPADLTVGGALKVEVQNEVPVTVAGAVEITNDSGSAIPVTSTQLPTALTSGGSFKTVSAEFKGGHANAWNNVSVGVGGTSNTSDDLFYVSKVSVFGTRSAATEIIIQFSANGSTFYDSGYRIASGTGDFGLTIDTASRYVRLKSVAAATITATINAK